MPEEQVLIVIKGKDEASKAFKSFADEAKKSGSKVESTFGKTLQKTGKQMTSVGKTLTLGVTGPLVAFGAVAVNGAMKAQRLEKTLEGLAGGADEAATYIDAIKKASQGTVSQIDALAAANRALSFDVVQTTEGMAELTEIAVALGRAQGLDAATAVNDLTTSLARQSPMILDNLGITLRVSEASKIAAEHAHEFGLATGELTKAQEFQIAALVKGREAVERMGGIQDDAAASAERMKAQMSDMTTQIGTSLLPIMQQGLDIVTPLVQKFTEMDPATQKLAVGFGAAAAAAGPLLTAGGKLVGTFGDLFVAVDKAGGGMKGLSGVMNTTKGKMLAGVGVAMALYGAYKAIEGVLDDIAQGQRDVNRALAGWVPEVADATKRGESLTDVMGEMADRANQVGKDLRVDGGILTDVAAAIVRSTSASKIWNEVQREAGRAALYAADNYEEYRASIERYNYTVIDSRAKIEAVDEAIWNHQNTLYRYYEALKQADQMQEEHNAELLAVEGASDSAVRALAAAGYAASDLNLKMLSYTDIMNHAVPATREHGDALDRWVMKEELAKTRAEEHGAAMEASGTLIMGVFGKMEGAVQSFQDVATAAWQSQQGELANLIASLKEATQEQFLQKMLAEIDPAKVGGALEWAKIGEAMGLIGPEQVAMAQGIEAFNQAIDAGKIADYQTMADTAKEIYTWANEKNPDLADLAEIMGTYAENIEPAVQPTEDLSDLLDPLGADYLPKAVEGAQDFREVMGTYPERLKNTVETVGGLDSAIQSIEGDHHSDIFVRVHWTGPGLPSVGEDTDIAREQFGGRVPGPVGSPQLVLAHGGEYVLNPHQRGAMGGPGGPMPPSTMATAATYNTTYNIFDHLAFAMAENIERERRFGRLESLM